MQKTLAFLAGSELNIEFTLRRHFFWSYLNLDFYLCFTQHNYNRWESCLWLESLRRKSSSKWLIYTIRCTRTLLTSTSFFTVRLLIVFVNKFQIALCFESQQRLVWIRQSHSREIFQQILGLYIIFRYQWPS